MVDLWQKKGMTSADANELIGLFAQYPSFFVDVMMVEELGMTTPDAGEVPWKNGVITFFSFLCFGTIPLWFYTGFAETHRFGTTDMFIVAAFATAFAVFLLGAFKSRYTKQRWWLSGIIMVVNGCSTAIAAYFLGYGLEKGFNVTSNGT